MTNKPYQVCLYVGNELPVMEGVNVVDLTPATASIEDTLLKLRSSNLTPADLRARVLFHADSESDKALLVYAALLGFAGRRLDVTDGNTLINASELDAMARNLPMSPRPEVTPLLLQLGSVVNPNLRTISSKEGLSEDDVASIKYARRLRFVPDGSESPTMTALSQLLIVAGIRARKDVDRLPFLCKGDEEVLDNEEDLLKPVGLCLDTMRREAVELRRTLRFDDRNALVEKGEVDMYQSFLNKASEVSIEETMLRLGASLNEETGLWHCPRPQRHTNGDANASMKVSNGKTQCFRCDPEKVDALRLVMDAKDYTVDEAATWLLDGTLS